MGRRVELKDGFNLECVCVSRVRNRALESSVIDKGPSRLSILDSN